MQTTKKKPSLIFIFVGAVLAGYLGYLINGAWIEGIAFNEFKKCIIFIRGFDPIMDNKFIPFNQVHKKDR